MIEFPNKICKASVFEDKDYNKGDSRKFDYHIYGENGEDVVIPKILRKDPCEYLNDLPEDVEISEKDMYGFSIVQYSNGNYGYLGKLGNHCISKYDFVTPFDESGYAFAGKGGKVFLINKSMQYLSFVDRFTTLVPDTYFSKYRKFQINGFQHIEGYSDGKHPLCRASLISSEDNNINWSYYNTLGERVRFKEFNFEERQGYNYEFFKHCSSFIGDVAIVEDGLLFSNGKYYKKDYILAALKDNENIPLSSRKAICNYLEDKSYVLKRI